jgi:hypothetical protein
MRLVEFTQTLAESDNPVASAITRRIIMQRTDLLSKYGPALVTQAIDDVADFVGDTEEIGSSDVSGWVKQVEQSLAGMGQQGVAEGSQRVDSLVTDALRIMKGAEVSDAVSALKTVLGDREYNSRRGFYNFYIKQMMDMYSQQGVAEAGPYGSNNPDTMSSNEYDRYQQDQMDQSKRDFKRREHEHEWEQEKAYSDKLAAQDRGPWYIRIDGKIYRQSGQPKVFDWKKGANNYALAMVKNNPGLQGKVMLSKSAEDK